MEKSNRPDWLKSAPKGWDNSIFVLLQDKQNLFFESGWIAYDSKRIHIHDMNGEFIQFTHDIELEKVVLIIVQNNRTKKTIILMQTTLVEPKYSY
ncbi:hypothetical protein GW950_00080 [Candidatus Wolfebacteria bacterium]|nr:hypothetical protein [Candidatus Wolfebacteria bacterium]